MNDVPSVPAGAGATTLDKSDVRRIIIGVLVAMLLAAIDQTIVATALPTIGNDLGDLAHLPWVVTAYLLSATAVTPLYGKLADIIGRRTTLLTAISIFMAGSVLCALSPSLLFLIIARFIQGLGGGALIALAQTIVADVVAAARTHALRGLFRGGVRDLIGRRSGAWRVLRRAPALVGDLLDQPAARTRLPTG